MIKIRIKSEFGSSEYIAKFLRSCILWMQFIENLYLLMYVAVKILQNIKFTLN